MSRSCSRWLIACGCLAAWSLSGCETPGEFHLVKDLSAPRGAEADTEEHRARFVEDRDPAAFRWLLTHALQNGMAVQEVNLAMGDAGERMDRDQALKAEQGEYLQTDIAYKWGPDRNGQSVILFFRDGHLVNFRPKDFAALP